MAEGDPPTVDVVERFARAAGLDANAWRALAGYERLDTPVSYYRNQAGEIAVLCERLGLRPLEAAAFSGGTTSQITSYEIADEVIESILADLRRDYPALAAELHL